MERIGRRRHELPAVEGGVPRLVVACVDQQSLEADVARDADGPSQCIDQEAAPEAGSLLVYVDRQACQQQTMPRAARRPVVIRGHRSMGAAAALDVSGASAMALGCGVRPECRRRPAHLPVRRVATFI